MTKQPWEVPDPPRIGDATSDITFRAVGAALSQWEYFEGNLSLAFSFLIGSGYGNVAALRAYGSVESFRGRANMIEEAGEVYFKYEPDEKLQASIKELLTRARQLSGRRNEIAHGIVSPYFETANDKNIHNGFVLYPAYYATRKRKLPQDVPLTDVTLTYVYSSVEIGHFGRQFDDLAIKATDILTDLARHTQGKISR